MKLEGAKNRMFSMGVWFYIEILKQEKNKLSVEAETALDFLEEDLKQIANQNEKINLYKNTIDSADWLIKNLKDINENIPVRNLDESMLVYEINLKILKDYERNESDVKDSQAGS